MSVLEDKLHDLIEINLDLLKRKGHNIAFEKGMFKNRNEQGFENVGYALLFIIDPIECKQNIHWPLLNDKTAKNNFRTNFVKFIKTLNKKHPDAHIPELTTSHLRHPGGERFLHLMHKLSTFALKLEIIKMQGGDKHSTLLAFPEFAKVKSDKANSVKAAILKGACCQTKQLLCQNMQLKSAASEKSQQLKTIYSYLSSELKSAKEQLSSQLSFLPIEEVHMKQRLLDVEDRTAMAEWNSKTKEKIIELETSCQKLCNLRDLTVKTCHLVDAAEKKQLDSLCLDGSKLSLPSTTVSDWAGGPVVNARGQVKLEPLLKAAIKIAQHVAPSTNSSSQTPLLPLAQDLLAKAEQQNTVATDATQGLLHFINDTKEMNDKQLETLCAEMNKADLPEPIQFLEERPPLQFLCQESETKTASPLNKKKRKSFNTISKLYLGKRSKVVCSVKTRRSIGRYKFDQTPRQQKTYYAQSAFKVPSTSFSFRRIAVASSTTIKDVRKERDTNISFHRTAVASSTAVKNEWEEYISPEPSTRKPKLVKVTPACKRSIYGKLPTGSRAQVEEDFEELPNPFSGDSFADTTMGSDSAEDIPLSPDHFQIPSHPKQQRKSLQNIIDRYNEIKSRNKENIVGN